MKDVKDYLEELYSKSLDELGSSDCIVQEIDDTSLKQNLDVVLLNSEKAKGVLAVTITSLIYKLLHPSQDIRLHQANMDGGYSGRSFDKSNITPFMKEKKFPAMSESGWLTRSLEQNLPYDEHYTGSIKPPMIKKPFLSLINIIQNNEKNTEILNYIFQYLILQRNKFDVQLAKPTNLSISELVNLLDMHFFAKYSSDGASRLPSLAFYAVYQCLVNELKRFENKKLLDLANHNSADSQSGRIGDVDIIDEKNRAFEAVEIKHGVQITAQLVKDAYTKFSTTPVKRYYILSTANIKEKDKEEISTEIENIKRLHGCQVIVNGIIKSLQYYTRLLSDSFDFIENYVNLLENDTTIKFEHKVKWNELINNQ